jgi:hypothetical protein
MVLLTACVLLAKNTQLLGSSIYLPETGMCCDNPAQSSPGQPFCIKSCVSLIALCFVLRLNLLLCGAVVARLL